MTLTQDRAAGQGAIPARPRRPRGRLPLPVQLVVLAGALLVTTAASVAIGSESVPWAAYADGSHPMRPILEVRFDRTLLGLAVGAALGLAGACLQGLTRNPLGDPGILGINAGASFAMVTAISLLGVSGLDAYLWFSFAGAALAAVLVHAVASLGRDGATPVSLVIAGAALTAALTSWTSAVLLTDRATMESFRFWQVGTVGGRPLDVLVTGLPFLVVGALLALAGARVLDALALGDDLARGLGRRIALDRGLVGVAVVLLAGTATALAGPVAFVGLMAPHVVRSVTGPAHRPLLVGSAAVGAMLVVVADTAGRVVLPPAEVQVGIMTAVIGVPVLLVLIRRGRTGVAP